MKQETRVQESGVRSQEPEDRSQTVSIPQSAMVTDHDVRNPQCEPRIVGFLCNWCSYAGADKAGAAQTAYPPNVSIIKVMCSGRIDPQFVLKAFELGADGVLVLACHPGFNLTWDVYPLLDYCYVEDISIKINTRVYRRAGLSPGRTRPAGWNHLLGPGI